MTSESANRTIVVSSKLTAQPENPCRVLKNAPGKL
nr:MAG TPA: hypothetical protein [Caudoviricetes sp.]